MGNVSDVAFVNWAACVLWCRWEPAGKLQCWHALLAVEGVPISAVFVVCVGPVCPPRPPVMVAPTNAGQAFDILCDVHVVMFL